MNHKDIAIVGMSCFAPGAHDISEFWNNLVNGVDSITDVPTDRIDPRYFSSATPAVDRFYCKRGGFVPPVIFDPASYSILPIAVEGMDTAHLLALKMVYKALEDASVFEKKIPLTNAALIIGKGNYVGSAIFRAIDIVHIGEQIADVVKGALPDLPLDEVDKIKKAYQASRGRYQADSMPGLIPNLIASLISNKLDMHGPSYTIDAACASSLIALDHAVNEIQSGRSDIAIAGGIHDGQNATFWSIFSQLGALSRKQKITPFNEDADGLLISEGAGFVVIKSLEKAIADNDRIYAVIKGIGVSSDGAGVSVMAPALGGQKIAIEQAWQKAGLDKNKIGYIEAHGTATIVGDRTELSSLASVFTNDQDSNPILLGSVKSNIGHAMPAAGVFGLIKTSLALYHRQIPATLHCDRPLKDMAKTRFRPVQKLEKWDEQKYPLVAGVNAFGFGGINAHVVLEAYGEKKAAVVTSKNPFKDKVIALSAPTKEILIDKLLKGNFSNTGQEGKCRLVLFNPTKERIDKAIKFIEKDLVWKGRQDIWYTNEPLIQNGGKVVFMYPGFDPTANPEMDSIVNYFNLTIPKETVDNNPLVEQTFKLFHCSEAMNKVLACLNVEPDMRAGHSMGEWCGIRASGLFTEESTKELIRSLDPTEYRVHNIYFIALGCGRERVGKYLTGIPDLYLSNDNCPSQVLLCGTEVAIKSLTEELKKEQIYYQILSFQSGLHTPFIKNKVHLLEECFAKLEFGNLDSTTMWSCNSVDVYPTDPQAIKDLGVKHMLEPVLFRDLVEKLYSQENARVFVQIGAGSLVGFVDDILKDRTYSSISLNTHLRSTLEQLRRVLALLFIEGRKIDLDFLNVITDNQSSGVPEKGIKLTMEMAILKNLPLLSELSTKYTKTVSIDIPSLAIDTTHPVLAALNDNLREMALMQTEMAKLFQQQSQPLSIPKTSNTVQLVATPVQPVSVAPTTLSVNQSVAVQGNAGKVFEERLYVSLDTHPTLIDHALIKQPDYWECVADRSPVIPMTMVFELLAEAANKQDQSKKTVRIGPVSVFQWFEVNDPFEKTITGTWKSEDVLSVGIKNYASGEVMLRDQYLAPEPFYANPIDLGDTVYPLPTREEIYEDYMFHGSAYQGIEKVTDVTRKGIRTYITQAAGKGSLFDNVGQTFGLYAQLTLDVNFISFPVKIQEIIFYQDMHDQEGVFECVCLDTGVTDEFVNADMILKRDGRLWCVIKGWQNRRFAFDDDLWQLSLHPPTMILSKEIAPNIFFFYHAYDKSYCWDYLKKEYLNQKEKRHFESLQLNKQKGYLISRIAVKDSLRAFIRRKLDQPLYTYPIEFEIKHDVNNKPIVEGIDEAKGLEISIAHKGNNSVGVTSDKPVGVDIEVIEERTDGFMQISFTAQELELLKGKDIAEWSTRFWVAKEAYSKMLGVGLQGKPKQYEVKQIDGEVLTIENITIKTIKHQNFIIGWTQ